MRGEGLTSHGVASVHGAAVNGEKVGLAAQTRERHQDAQITRSGARRGCRQWAVRPPCLCRPVDMAYGPKPEGAGRGRLQLTAELHGRTPRA